MATRGNGTVTLWDVTSGRSMLSIHTSPAAWKFSPDGKRLATASYTDTTIWDANTGQELRTLHKKVSGVTSFCRDLTGMVIECEDESVKVWDLTNDREVVMVGARSERAMRTIAFSPEGKLLAIGHGNGTVNVFDTTTGRELLALPGYNSNSGAVTGVAFSPDGTALAVSRTGKLLIRQANDGRELLTLSGHSIESGMAFSHDWKKVATFGGSHAAQVWDTVNGAELVTLGGHTAQVPRWHSRAMIASWQRPAKTTRRRYGMPTAGNCYAPRPFEDYLGTGIQRGRKETDDREW